MKISKNARRDAKSLFSCCKVNGVLDEAFSDFVLNKTFGKWMLHKTDYTHFLEGLSELTLDKVGSSLH